MKDLKTENDQNNIQNTEVKNTNTNQNEGTIDINGKNIAYNKNIFEINQKPPNGIQIKSKQLPEFFEFTLKNDQLLFNDYPSNIYTINNGKITYIPQIKEKIKKDIIDNQMDLPLPDWEKIKNINNNDLIKAKDSYDYMKQLEANIQNTQDGNSVKENFEKYQTIERQIGPLDTKDLMLRLDTADGKEFLNTKENISLGDYIDQKYLT